MIETERKIETKKELRHLGPHSLSQMGLAQRVQVSIVWSHEVARDKESGMVWGRALAL